MHWKYKTEEQAQTLGHEIEHIVLDEGDKTCVRKNLLDALFHQITVRPIMKQYIRSMKNICIADYPDRMPHIVGDILKYLKMENTQAVYTGLMGLFALCSVYQFELDEAREPLYPIL